jgi:hypothetical protein
MAKTHRSRRDEFFYHHSLSLVAIALLIVWIICYVYSNPNTHLGSFFGNAIADWSGSVILIIGTKYLLEFHSAESRRVKGKLHNRILDFLWRHSLLIFIILTGIGWTILFRRMDAQSKWGQVVGNLVSEWGQMGGLVFLTKRLVEKGSKESGR